jgi:hypothetical protein
MPRPKKRPWNADMKLPGYLGEPAHVVKPAPQTLTVGHSTAQHFVEEHTVTVTLGPRGQMIATEGSRPAVIRVEGEAVEKKPQLPPEPPEQG